MADSETEPIEVHHGDPIDPVPTPDGEPALDPAAEPVADGDRPLDRDFGRPYRVGAWVVLVGALALAAFFVAVPAHTYDLDFRGRAVPETRRIDLIELWRVQTRNLPDVRYETLFQVAYVACAIIFLLGSAALVWLAMVEIRPSAPPAARQTQVANASSEPSPAD